HGRQPVVEARRDALPRRRPRMRMQPDGAGLLESRRAGDGLDLARGVLAPLAAKLRAPVRRLGAGGTILRQRGLELRQRILQPPHEVVEERGRVAPNRERREVAQERQRAAAVALAPGVLVEARYVEQAVAAGDYEHAARTQPARRPREEFR